MSDATFNPTSTLSAPFARASTAVGPRWTCRGSAKHAGPPLEGWPSSQAHSARAIFGSVLAGDLVREARRRAGLTQRELAERAGTTQSAIARLEAGRTRPAFDTVLRLIAHCGFRLDVALDPDDDSDVAQAEASLRLSVDERLDRLIDVVEQYRSLREEAARHLA